MTPGKGDRLALLIALGCIVLLAAALRLYGLGDESFYSDEWASVAQLDAGSFGEFLARVRVHDPPMTPLFFTLEYAWHRVAGAERHWLRLLPLFFGLLAIPLLFRFAQLMYGRLAGLTAALCCALSLSMVFFAQEMRPYALVLVLALISNISLWTALNGRRPRHWGLNVAANSLLLFTHFFTGLMLLAQGCYLVGWAARRGRVRTLVLWVAAQVPALLLLAFWLLTIDRAALSVAASWRLEIQHSYLQLLGDLLLFSGAGVPTFRDLSLWGGVSIGGLFWRVFALILALYAVLAWRQDRLSPAAEPAAPSRSAFLLTQLTIPSAALFLFSALIYSCHSSRYVLFACIPFFTIVGATVSLLPRRWMQAAAVLALVCLYGMNQYAYGRPLRPDLQSAAHYIAAKSDAASDVRIVVRRMSDLPTLPFNGPASLKQMPLEGVTKWEDVPGAVGHPESQGRQFLVLTLHQASPAEVPALAARLRASGWSLDERVFGWANPVYVFELTSN